MTQTTTEALSHGGGGQRSRFGLTVARRHHYLAPVATMHIVKNSIFSSQKAMEAAKQLREHQMKPGQQMTFFEDYLHFRTDLNECTMCQKAAAHS